MQHVYGLFGFEFRLELSTRPDNYLGDIDTWNTAEDVRPIHLSLKFDLIPVTATEILTRQTLPRRMGPQPRRWSFLRAKDRHHHP